MNGFIYLKKIVGALTIVILIYGLSVLIELLMDYIFIKRGLVEPNMAYGSLRDSFNYIILISLTVLFIVKQKDNVITNRKELSLTNILVVLLFTLFYRVAEDPLINLEILMDLKVFPKNNEVEYSFFRILMLIVNFVILSPILEELVFRKIVLGHYLSNKITFGIVFSSLLFSIKHILTGSSNLDYIELLAIFIFGVFAAVVYIRFGFFYAVLFHSFYNLIWLIIGLNINRYWEILQELNFGTIYWLLIFISFFLFLFFLLYNKEKDQKA